PLEDGQQTCRRAVHRRSDQAGVHVEEVRLASDLTTVRGHVPGPCLRLMRDGAQLPNAESWTVYAGEFYRLKSATVIPQFDVRGLPELVRVAPGRDDQEDDIAAIVQDHEPDLAV